jgi:glycosyltransferase involved in cell wall biosynthesis
MAGARALVHPATYEGFGFTPLEAMAAGTPVAVSRAGSLPEIVGDAGLLVDAEDEAAWAAAIRELLHDAESRAGLVARGRARAARFQWGATAAAVAALHQEVLARPS